MVTCGIHNPFELQSNNILNVPTIGKELVMMNTGKTWPCGLMDKASDFESEDCEFESRRGRRLFAVA